MHVQGGDCIEVTGLEHTRILRQRLERLCQRQGVVALEIAVLAVGATCDVRLLQRQSNALRECCDDCGGEQALQ